MLKQIDHGPIRELNIDRPPVNALNPELVTKLTMAINDSAKDCSALVISGREGVFSAGLDVPELLQLSHAGMNDFLRRFFGLLEAVARCPVPVAAAITGHSPAGGAVLGIFCDYRVMSRGDFLIGLNETRVGLVVPSVIRHALIRLTGAHRAERLIVAGTLFGPEEALASGMVDALSESPDTAVTDAINWCHMHLGLPSHAMLGNRSKMRQDVCEPFDSLGEKDVAEFVDGWFSEPAQATLHAVLEKLKDKT